MITIFGGSRRTCFFFRHPRGRRPTKYSHAHDISWKNDAACRVIARLHRERDEALAQVQAQRTSLAQAQAAAPAAAAAVEGGVGGGGGEGGGALCVDCCFCEVLLALVVLLFAAAAAAGVAIFKIGRDVGMYRN